MWILGFAASHNGGAALIQDARVVVAIQTERLTRKKRDGSTLESLGERALLPVRYCLDYAGIGWEDLECIATCTPWHQVDASFSPEVLAKLRKAPRFLSVPHHLAHAEYVLHYSPMEPCLVLVCDGSGTREAFRPRLDIQEKECSPQKFLQGLAKESISAYRFENGTLSLVYRLAYGKADLGDTMYLNSVGHLWRWVAEYCHGSQNEAGKVMGLAPYGDPDVHDDLEYLSWSAGGEVRIDFKELCRRFQTPNAESRDVTGETHYADLAANLQKRTNNFLLSLLEGLRRRFAFDTLCYSGGLALNGIANEIVSRELALRFCANGSCEDNGTAIGAALAVYHHLTGERVPEEPTEYYGRTYSPTEIEAAIQERNLPSAAITADEVLDLTTDALAAGEVVGWFQGRSEFGPRALGNRSILADPRRPDMKNILNSRVKFREGFRPYAPAVLEQNAETYFDLRGVPSPAMLRVSPVKVDSLPAITHVDGSARVQTVHPRQNPVFHDLIECFGRKTGIPVVLNTSFNVAGEPIVETPDDALRTFLASKIDLLVLGAHVIRKSALS